MATKKYQMTDAKLVAIAKRLQKMSDRAREIIDEIESSDHPNASECAADFINQCFGLAWPEHVVHHYLVDRSKYKTSELGIRKVGKDTSEGA